MFGDNLEQEGTGGQAKATRGESNTFGIVTKIHPDHTPDAYFKDKDAVIFSSLSNKNFENLYKKIHDYDMVAIPTGGLGTGLAKLPESSPKCFNILNFRLMNFIGESFKANYYCDPDTEHHLQGLKSLARYGLYEHYELTAKKHYSEHVDEKHIDWSYIGFNADQIRENITPIDFETHVDYLPPEKAARLLDQNFLITSLPVYE